MEIQDVLLKIIKFGKEFLDTLEKTVETGDKSVSKPGTGMPQFTPDVIRDLSKGVGSQKKLADELGVSAGTINRWVTNRSLPRQHHLVKMTELYRKHVIQDMGLRNREGRSEPAATPDSKQVSSSYILRLARGVGSQRRLAEMLKVHHVSVNKWVKGLSTPRSKFFPKLKEIEEQIERGIITPIRKATGLESGKKAVKPKKRAAVKKTAVKKTGKSRVKTGKRGRPRKTQK